MQLDKDIIRIYLINELEKLQGQSIEGQEHTAVMTFIEDKIKELKCN